MLTSPDSSTTGDRGPGCFRGANIERDLAKKFRILGTRDRAPAIIGFVGKTTGPLTPGSDMLSPCKFSLCFTEIVDCYLFSKTIFGAITNHDGRS